MSKLADSPEERVAKLVFIVEEASRVLQKIKIESCGGFIVFKTETNVSGEAIESFTVCFDEED